MSKELASVIVMLLGLAVPEVSEARKPRRLPDTVRVPFERGKLYGVQLLPGAPFLLELPAGESARHLWFDDRWWAVETAPGGSRVVLRASSSEDVVGKTGFVHIETEPSNLRISLRVEAVEEYESVSAALELYVASSPLNDPVKQQARKLADREMIYAQKMAAEKARAEVAAFRRRAIEKMRTNFEWGGDFRIARVVDDGVQTFILLADAASDRAVIQFVDKAGKAETVNHELENGTYVVQNKVLRSGEKFRLILGKQMAWVALK